MARNGGLVVRHRELEMVDDELLWANRVHLNTIGIDMWTLGIRKSIESALRFWSDDRV